MSEYQDHNFNSDKPLYGWHYIQQPLLSLLSKEKNTCILDLGCGNGYFVKYLISQGFNAYGIDASTEGIDIAKKTHPDNFFIQDLSENSLPEPIQDLPFDTIISTEVVEHLYNPFTFMALCKDVLSPTRGELIMSTPYHGYLKNLMLSVFDKWDVHTNPVAVGAHIKFWSKATLSRLLTESGFKMTDFIGCGRYPYMWKSMIVKANFE